MRLIAKGQAAESGFPLVATATRLATGGTLPRAPEIACPNLARRVWLIGEILLFFVVAPLLLRYAVFELRIPLFLLLPPLLLAFIIYLLCDRTFEVKRELTRGFSAGDLVSILAIFLIAGGCVAAFVAQEMPGRFLSFPRGNPELWKLVMVLYPLLSVIAQEFVYRTFFFHRYGPLFDDRRVLAIVANGLLFGFAHILFNNWVAVVGTALAGTLFAYRYTETGSFWAVWFEHTLWGWLVFTVGLGAYFFTGIANPML